MNEAFETLIDSFLSDRLGEAGEFIDVNLSTLLKNDLQTLFLDEKFHNAGIGNELTPNQNKEIRRDKIFWLDRKHQNDAQNAFLDVIDEFVSYLNKTCFTGITGYEFHYAMYEKGSFYKKHFDQFRNNKKRAYTMIVYLNSDWVEADGGELCVHHTTSLQLISPNNGKCVFFKSNEMEHEVLVTNKLRMSITGWLKTD